MRTEEEIADAVFTITKKRKPEGFLPIDILQAVRLAIEPFADIGVHIPQEELATQLHSSRESIARSQTRLEEAGWLKVTRATKTGQTNRLALTEDGIRP